MSLRDVPLGEHNKCFFRPFEFLVGFLPESNVRYVPSKEIARTLQDSL